MTRFLGAVLLLALLLGAVSLRLLETRRADRLLLGEARARDTLAALARESLAFTRAGRPHPGLRGELLSAAPDLQPLPDLGTAQVSYARDDAYVYGLATRTHRPAESGPLVHGWVLRAWPARFGVTGDVEYHLTEDGLLWEGQNRTGRSGTDHGFPPPFPEPELGQPRASWWQVPLPGHM